MPLRRIMLLMVVLIAAACPVPMLYARVFQGGGSAGDVFDPLMLGRRIYQAVMQINGGRAEVTVVSCEGGTASVRAAVQAVKEDPSARYVAGEDVGFGKASANGRQVRLMTLTTGAESKTLMVSVGQSDADAKASCNPDIRHQIDDVPVPAEARVLSFMKNLDTRTALEQLAIRMPAERARRYFESVMPRGGWTPMFRASGDDGLVVFVKGADVCCVRIRSSDSDGESSVTLLHKQGAVN